MTIFGDYEPEDAWDVDDTIAEQLVNLFRRMQLVDAQPAPQTVDPHERLLLLEDRVRQARRSRVLDPRVAYRVAQIVEDIGYVRGRLP